MIDQTRQRLGAYRLSQLLGKGSFADVYLGTHCYLKHEVALKVLYGRIDKEAVEAFLREVGYLRELEHPHIVRMLDVGIEEDIPYLVMEYAPGGTLRARHRNGERLSLAKVVAYVQQIAQALDYAHDRQLIHRDLKPENLLVGKNEQILLSDFGMALPWRHTDAMNVQVIGGTLAYMAPEQIRGGPCPASDQYALAILAYEWLTGSCPFVGTTAELCGQHLFVPPVSLTVHIPELPPAVDLVVRKALAKDPEQRFTRVSDFADFLNRASRGETISLTQEMTSGEVELAATTPALPTPQRKPFYNLPAQVSSLIGRETELQAACVLLARPEIRLLTIIGAGGIGKTALALVCVSEVLPAFRDGTCFVSLASISDSDQVIPALIQTLGIKEQHDLPPITSLKQVLHDKHLLLVLDNFEQVLDAAPLLLDLLQSCPELKMVVTSRAVLHVPGEHTFPVPPLAVPDLLLTRRQELESNASIRLFVERARALKRGFQLTDTNVAAVAELCRQLDGLPLALELAAARITVLSPQQLLVRLTRRLDLLAQKGSAAPTRQQTMRQTIQWSYDLLDTQEQLLFARLSVFAGGCTLSDVEALFTLLGDDPFQALDGVASLTDKSLLFQQEQESGEPRFFQLEIIREFSQERLVASGELERTRAAHARHYASFAPVPEPAQLGLAQGAFVALLKREYQNLLAALRFFLERHEREQMLQLVLGMGGIWAFNGYGSSGQEEIERVLDAALAARAQIDQRLLSMAFILAARIAIVTTDLPSARTWLHQGLTFARTLSDQSLVGLTTGALIFVEAELGHYAEAEKFQKERFSLSQALSDQGLLARACETSCLMWLYGGKVDQARAVAEEGIRLAEQVGGQMWVLAMMWHCVGWIDYLQKDFVSAHACGQKSVALFRELSFSVGGLEALCQFAHETMALGHQDIAQALMEEALTLSQEAGDTPEIGRALCGLGYQALRQGDAEKARLLFEDSLRTLFQVRQMTSRFTYILASNLEGLACIASQQKQPTRAAWLLGAADALRHTGIGTCLLGQEDPFWQNAREAALFLLGSPAFSRAFAEGSRMSPAQALATQEPEAYPDMPSPAEDADQPVQSRTADLVQPARPGKGLPFGEHLTRREVEVLRLLVHGYSNAEIAQQLVLSVVTINSYLRSVYGKLGVSSRTKAARYALDHHLI